MNTKINKFSHLKKIDVFYKLQQKHGDIQYIKDLNIKQIETCALLTGKELKRHFEKNYFYWLADLFTLNDKSKYFVISMPSEYLSKKQFEEISFNTLVLQQAHRGKYAYASENSWSSCSLIHLIMIYDRHKKFQKNKNRLYYEKLSEFYYKFYRIDELDKKLISTNDCKPEIQKKLCFLCEKIVDKHIKVDGKSYNIDLFKGAAPTLIDICPNCFVADCCYSEYKNKTI